MENQTGNVSLPKLVESQTPANQDRLTFSVKELKRLYYDLLECESLSLEKIEEIQEVAKVIHSDLGKFYYRSREGDMTDYMDRFTRYMKVTEQLGVVHDRGHPIQNIVVLHRYNLEYGLLYLHFYAFLPPLELLSSDEQRKRWVQPAKELKFLGAYAQSEIGHGSDVQSLKTTATYDPATKEFIFNTPCLEATKFWPGVLGKSATHILLFAKLITKGKDCGVQAFIVQIRDMATHKLLPGIEAGDVGTKIALTVNDNGYLKINNIRRPKDSLLCRYVQVQDDGTFTRTTTNTTKLEYGGMLNLRLGIHSTCQYYIGKQATIATRYAFRRQ